MTQDVLEKYPMWFCPSIYDPAGVPKLEKALMDFAKQKFTNAIFDEDAVLPDCVDILEAQAYVLLKNNPHCKAVKVSLVKNPILPNHWTVKIGNSGLNLIKVEHYYE